MSTLSKEYRRQLERAVLNAREEAERGAATALESYGVGEARKPAHLDEAGEDLRKKLRARGRQVGDVRRPDESQEVEHLIQECAYEHWHRMLFARFLAENGFVIEPESGLDVDLDFCEERARETNSDKWEVAAGFAQRMLAGVFRADDPVLQVRLPVEFRNRLTALLAGLPVEVFTAGDSLGWVYQFWQARKKEDVNASGVKIGADELPSVTQLFTEDYMVDFLLDNTLGAWWAGKKVISHQLSVISCPTEEAARNAVALPGCHWKYLRFIKTSASTDHCSLTTDYWLPAAGTFDGWPKTARELKCLDPCMGSGHFMVAMFERLVALRLAEENLDEAAAVAAVIRDNLFGLEIDPRCTQIAAFNLALAAWRRVGHCKLPAMNLACSGLAPNTREADWLAIAGNNDRLQRGMKRLYALFTNAPILGSLIDPYATEGDLIEANFREVAGLLTQALSREAPSAFNLQPSALESAVTARGLAKAAEILAGQFTLVATNVPYLSVSKHQEFLREHGQRCYPESRHDLATMFVERCLPFALTNALVTPQNWLFMPRYKKLRQRYLKDASWHFACKLGPGAFETISGEVVKAALIGISQLKPTPNAVFFGVDASESPTPAEKGSRLMEGQVVERIQSEQLLNPDARIVMEDVDSGNLLMALADSRHGLRTADGFRFLRFFWELPTLGNSWSPEQGTVERTVDFSGREQIVLWEDGQGALREFADVGLASLQGGDAWGKQGVTVSLMGNLPVTRYAGDFFDNNCAALWPKSPKDLAAVWAFCSSPEFSEQVRVIDQQLKVTSATLLKVPFDLAHWQKVAAEKYPDGLPKPFSSDPTQWLFNGHPVQKLNHRDTESTEKTAKHSASSPASLSVSSVPLWLKSCLQVAVARLLGYRWPRQTGSSFPDCPALGPDGLEKHADKDGLVCFSQVRNEPPAATRLRALLADAYLPAEASAQAGGADWSHALERKLIAATGSKAESLEDWLLNDFFAQHCELFHNRPFVWHIWDGRRDGFNVLVNYHKLCQKSEGKTATPHPGPHPDRGGEGESHAGLRTLESLTYAYLGDWITRQKDAVARGEAGADDRLAAALELQGELKEIGAGEPPYDLFIRWKPLHQQPIGWQPDINDGVRLNIRPFLGASLSRGKKGAGVLRGKLNVKWEKDRGKEPSRPKEDFPWFWKWDGPTVDFTGNDEFDGNRWNDCHYTTGFKRAARERKELKG